MKSLHALLVDDDAQVLETMGMILEMDDYRVSTAPNGVAALDRLERSEDAPPAVDFLVLDLDMANLSGVELLAELRRRGFTLPVMVVTGYASKATVVELLRQGVADFLDKPIHLDEFRARVHRLANQALRQRRARAGAGGFSPAPYRAATVLDLAGVGLPYAMRRRVNAAPESELVLAARKAYGFDLLIADVGGDDPESFYASFLVKTCFDRWRSGGIGGRALLASLASAVKDGALVPRDLRGLLLRYRTAARVLDAYPAGYGAAVYLGLGGPAPRVLELDCGPIGSGGERRAGDVRVEIPLRPGEQILLLPRASAPDLAAESVNLQERMLALPAGDLDRLADGAWQELLHSASEPRPFLLGIEAPGP